MRGNSHVRFFGRPHCESSEADPLGRAPCVGYPPAFSVSGPGVAGGSPMEFAGIGNAVVPHDPVRWPRWPPTNRGVTRHGSVSRRSRRPVGR